MNEFDDPAQATATVTITISRDAAEWVYREISGDNALTPTPFHLCSEAEAAFSSALGIQHPGTPTTSAVGTLVTALMAAPPPAPERDLEMIAFPESPVIATMDVTFQFVADEPPLLLREDFDDPPAPSELESVWAQQMEQVREAAQNYGNACFNANTDDRIQPEYFQSLADDAFADFERTLFGLTHLYTALIAAGRSAGEGTSDDYR